MQAGRAYVRMKQLLRVHTFVTARVSLPTIMRICMSTNILVVYVDVYVDMHMGAHGKKEKAAASLGVCYSVAAPRLRMCRCVGRVFACVRMCVKQNTLDAQVSRTRD